MKNILLAIAVLVAATALAVLTAKAQQAPAPPPAEKSVKVELTLLDLQVALIAINNAGAACDLGAKNFCQLLAARDGTLAKLNAAYAGLAPAGK